MKQFQIVDVTSENFEALKPEIIKHLKESDFVAFDLELTGIKGDYQDTFEEYPFERYLKLRKVSMKFNIITIGLSFFKGTSHKTYNIYLFPQEEDDTVGLQVGAIQFNKEHGMDFNKWISGGIGYVDEIKEAKLQEVHLPNRDDFDMIQMEIKAEDRPMIDEMLAKIDKFAKDPSGELLIDTKNSYQRKILYTYLQKSHPLILGEGSPTGGVKVIKVTQQYKDEMAQKRESIKQSNLTTKIGFTAIWKEIVQSQKPLVGHNCFADLVFIYSHFIGCPPVSYEVFKDTLVKRLPYVYDVKYIFSNSESLKDFRALMSEYTSVEKIYEYIKTKMNPEIHIEDTLEYHNAGYDALITGFNFYHFKLSQNEKQLMVNQMNLFKSNFTVNLLGPDPKLQTNKKILFFRLPEVKNTKQGPQVKRQLQEQQIQINKILEKNDATSKMIHFKYLMIEYKNDDLREQLDKIADTMADSQVLTEKQYYNERKDFKEKDAKSERFNK